MHVRVLLVRVRDDHGLAIVRRRQGQFDEAETLYLRSLDIREQTLGENHPFVANALKRWRLTAWSIVLQGAGMAKFDDLLTKEDVQAVHAYIIQRAKEDRALQLEAAQQ